MSLLASLFGAALLAAPGTVPTPGTVTPTPSDPLIYGGEPVEPGAWSGVAEINTGGKRCTGTLVTPNLVLTAAHCFDPAPVTDVRVTFGDTVMDGQSVIAEAWGSHPDFCLPTDCPADLHDFGWLRLPVDIQAELYLPITDQAEYDQAMVVGAELVFVGFGEDEDGTIGIKRQVTASLTSFNESGREFRAGGDGKDTCLGDSGGPALVQLSSGTWRLAGVISRGGECGGGGIYGVPLPELCWLRDDSGVDLLPAGCEACECVTLHGEQPDEGCDCRTSGPAAPRGPGRWSELGGMLAALLGLGWMLRRRRAASA